MRNLICEAPNSFYIPGFEKSNAFVDNEYEIKFPIVGIKRSGSKLSPWRLNNGQGNIARIKNLDSQEWEVIINEIKGIVSPELKKYEPYYVNQVLNGSLPLSYIIHYAPRLNKTVKDFIKLSRKSIWTGSTDIFRYENWESLEEELNKFRAHLVEQDIASENKVLYKHTYGTENHQITFWFRAIYSPEAASKYGKGTQWCTNSTPAQRGSEDYDKHDAHQYLNSCGLYIVEHETPTTRRRPIIQIAGNEIKDINDEDIVSVEPMIRDFLKRTIQNAENEINEQSVIGIINLISNSY